MRRLVEVGVEIVGGSGIQGKGLFLSELSQRHDITVLTGGL